MRLKVSSLSAVYNRDLRVEFGAEKLSSYGGLELLSGFFRSIDLATRLRKSLRGTGAEGGDYGAARLDFLFRRFCGLLRSPSERTVVNWLKTFTRRSLATLSDLIHELVCDDIELLGLRRLTIDLDGSVMRTGSQVACALASVARWRSTSAWTPRRRPSCGGAPSEHSMKLAAWLALATSAIPVALTLSAEAPAPPEQRLPPATTADRMSVTEALAKRRSWRRFATTPLTRAEVSQLCWAAQGITDREGHRTAPSAGATYPLVVFVADATGVYRYDPHRHALEGVLAGDVRPRLESAAHGQESVGTAPLVLALAIDLGRTAARYGRRAERYCLLEAGHAAQNVLLEATAMGLGGVPIGAFDDAALDAALRLPANLRAVYLLPLGHPG